ncbi:MAG: duplicated hybrid motif [Verrucomicrobiaceae bacterium]|nr:duplicated hybrid motif [Verrucomicrobiaceae bacterium]
MANTLQSIVFAPRAVLLWVTCCGVMVAIALQAAESIRCPMADGFDHAVGKPNAVGYYKARGFTPNGHLGDDWNGNGGGDTDLGAPVYSIGNGVVLHAMDIHVGWGNVVIIRHAFRDETGKIQFVDSLYGHLHEIKVRMNQIVARGELIGTIGSNHGMYPAHLHLEVHKNLSMGPTRTGFAHDYSNYYSPTQFIESHRTLNGSFAKVEIPINTFAPYGEPARPGTQYVGPGPSSAPSLKISGRSLSIPVYRGSVPPVASSYGPGTSSSKRSSIVPSAPTAPPTMTVPTESDDFWGKVKSKLKNGKIESAEPK